MIVESFRNLVVIGTMRENELPSDGESFRSSNFIKFTMNLSRENENLLELLRFLKVPFLLN